MASQKREEILKCPYDETHEVRASRFQCHLHKCAKYHPRIKLEQCPFSYEHFLPPTEIEEHKKSCPSRIDDFLIETFTENFKNLPKIEQPKAKCDENWDHYNEPTYDPQKHCLENPIIRSCIGKTFKERRNFIRNEKKRFMKLEKMNK